MGRLQDKRAIITGADSGIGRAVAVAFADEGADVVIVYLSDEEAARETRGQVEALGRRSAAIRADVGDEAQVERVYREALAALGGLEVLVNNAAVEQRGPWEGFALRDWERLLRTNVTG